MTGRAGTRRWATIVLLALVACSPDDSTKPNPEPSKQEALTPATAEWAEPGLVDPAGQPVHVPEPAGTRGARIDVIDYGADPEPGTGDDAEAIRRALRAAEPGDEVHLDPGVYDLESTDPEDPSTNLTLISGVHLRGAGTDATVLRSSFDGDDDSSVLRGKNIEEVVVAELTVTSTYDGPLGTDPDDDDASGGPMFGIHIGETDGRGSARVLVEHVRVERFQRHGISVKASREVTVRDSWVADATSVGTGGSGYGIAVEGRADQRDPEAANDSRHNQVVGNHLDGTHLRHAILLQFPTHNNLVAENEVRGSRLDAIDLHGEGEYLNEIRDNTVIGCARAAIALGNSGGSTHQHGASGEENWVHDNLLIGNREGIVVILGTPDSLIEANRIRAGEGSRVGVLLDDAPRTVLRNNEIDSHGVPGFVAVDD